MDLTEKKLQSELMYDGKIVRLLRDCVELPNGKTAVREVVRHPGGVIVLPVDEQGNVHLVRQFRYACGTSILEVPAGKLEYGEQPLAAAMRELEEEIGAAARRWTSLGAVWPTPGFCDEVQHLYLARELSFGQTHPDEDEFLEQVCLPLEEAAAMAADGRMRDSKSVIAILRARLRMEEERHG